MSNKRTNDEQRKLTSESSEPVPEADALEQAEEIVPDEEDETPPADAEVPEADAIEQSRIAPVDDEHL